MSSELSVVQPVSVSSKRQQLAALARSGLRLFIGVAPAVMGAGLLGALKGAAIFGLTGMVVGTAYLVIPRLLGSPPVPLWLDILSGVLPALALAIAGGYILMLQGVTTRLARELQERGMVGYLYAIIKPAVVQVAHRLKGSDTLSRAELSSAIERSVAERLSEAVTESDKAPTSFAERLERFLMDYSRRVVGLVALRTALSAPDVPTAVKNLEALGIDRVENALAETLEDFFFLQIMLALLAGLLVAAAPALLMSLVH